MEEVVAEVAICEGVGAIFEPDYYCVQLAEGADARVVDVVVYYYRGDQQVERGVGGVSNGDVAPGGVEVGSLLAGFRGI